MVASVKHGTMGSGAVCHGTRLANQFTRYATVAVPVEELVKILI